MPSIKSVGTVSTHVKRKDEQKTLEVDADKVLQHPDVVKLILQRFMDRGLQNPLEDRQQTLRDMEQGIMPSSGGGGARLSPRVQAIREIIGNLYRKAGWKAQDIKAGNIARAESDEDQAISGVLAAMYEAKHGAEPSQAEADNLWQENAEQIRTWIAEEEQRLIEAEKKTAGLSI